MTIRAGYFGVTSKHTVTGTPDGFTVEGPAESRHTFLVLSDVTIHMTRDGTDASADNGLRIVADTPVLVACFAGDQISYVLGVGESDGNVWFTATDH